MAHGVPTSATPVSNAPRAEDALSVLTLEFAVLDDGPDWPVLEIRVDGRPPFAQVAADWHGFDPGRMLGAGSPLLPHGSGRRVALYRCSCGEAGCGVIAAVIVASPAQQRVSWVDFRDYVGVFARPVEVESADHEGTPWDLADIHFDRDQYVAEVQRATRDPSWETPRRQTARRLEEHLRPMNLVLPPDLTLRFVSPAWNTSGVVLSFEQTSSHERTLRHRQEVLLLDSDADEPSRAAKDMAQRLLSTPPGEWVRAFGHHVP